MLDGHGQHDDWVVGVDIGGTFTDCVAMQPSTGTLHSAKVLTDQRTPELGVIRAIDHVRGERFGWADIRRLVHGTTLAINTVLERSGPRIGLITTEGFRDTLEMANGNRYDIYDLQIRPRAPLVPRRYRLGVTERLAADGSVVVPLDKGSVMHALDVLDDAGVEAVAVCLLHAYANDAHERAVGELVASRLPGCHVSLSSAVAPIIREYERTVATVLNAYVGPVVSNYLGRLRRELDEHGFAGELAIMKSDGGTCTVTEAAGQPIQILESGPAAGTLATSRVATAAGLDRVVAFDMGGTTAKACLILDGAPGFTSELEVDRQERALKGSGLPIRLPSVDLVEVGAGGNSLARLGDLGLLTVGPESADSTPGPACYGLGGTAPTVTDADLVLGFLDEASFAGGSMLIHTELARAAIVEHVSGSDTTPAVIAASWGIHDLVNETMALAIRLQCVEHGIDPASVTLVATGGAGPVHAAHVMRKLGITHAVCPANAGVASAIGLAIAPKSEVVIVSSPAWLAGLSAEDIGRRFGALEQRAREQLEPGVEYELTRWLELRVKGQGYEFPVDVAAGDVSLHDVTEAFEGGYIRAYGHAPASSDVEVVTWGLRFQSGRTDFSMPSTLQDGMTFAASERDVYFDAHSPVATRVVAPAMVPHTWQPGPVIVQAMTTAVVVPPGVRLRRDEFDNIHLEVVS